MENNKKTIITNIIRVAHIGSWAFVLSVVGAVVAGFMNYAFSMVIGFVSTEALRQANIGVFEWSKFQSIIVLSIVMLPFMFLGQMLNLTGGMKADKKLKQAMFSKVLKQKARNMSESHSASIMTLLTSDSWSLDDFYFQGINYRVIHPLVGGIAAIITMVVLDYRLAIIAVTLGLLSIWASVVYTDKMQAAFELARIKNEAGVTSASEIISNELMIRQFGVQSKVINSYDKKNQEVEEAMSEAEFIQHKVTRLQSIINMISILVFIAAGYYLSIKGNFDITQIMLLLSLKSVVGYMFLSLGDSWQFFVEVSSAADRIFKFMDAPLEDFRETLPSIELNKDNVLLSIQDLSFRYKETNVLNKINLEFKTGKGSALVGPSGSGKSSIFRMILGLYDDYEGNILINNKDVSEFNLSSIRDLVVSVEQENPLFNRSIYENIALGSKNYDTVSLEDVIGVSKQGGIHDFITSLDKGYDTLVGEGGSSLSGGQKQRIAIARALMSQAPIMIFDEPTAALDGESERQIQSVIENIAKDKVVLVSAHRLSTIKNMEQIIVVKNGTIDESGTHHELINNNGTYAELVSQNGGL